MMISPNIVELRFMYGSYSWLEPPVGYTRIGTVVSVDRPFFVDWSVVDVSDVSFWGAIEIN
jgi:hypothetical protein